MTSKRAVLDEIAIARDKARVRVHLLSLEARERWYELEAALDSLEQQLTSGQGALKVREEAHEIISWVERLLASSAPATGLKVKAGSIMSREVPTCLPYASLRNAVQALRSSARGAVPVVDEEARLLGIVTERNLCDAACLQGKPFSVITIDSAMTEDVKTCSPEDSLARVLSIMSDAQVYELPVVDAHRKVLGMIDFAAMTRFIVSACSPDTAAAIALLNTVIAVSAPPANNYSSAAE